VTTEDFIQNALDTGQRNGVAGLSALQRAIFIVSELEVLCDMEGIDAFLDRYQASELRGAADLLLAAGAVSIANGLVEIAEAMPNPHEATLNHVNDLVTARAGYDHDALARAVAQRLAHGES
jgi:hypothetical protein